MVLISASCTMSWTSVHSSSGTLSIRLKTHSRNSRQRSGMFIENKTEVSEFYTDCLVISTSLLLQSFPASGSFPVSWLFAPDGKLLELQLQHQSFQWVFRIDFLLDWLVWSYCLLQCHSSKASIHRCSTLSSVQSFSRVWLFATRWTAVRQAFLSITNSWRLLKLMPIELVMPSNHLILCHLILLLPSVFPSIMSFLLSQLFASGGQYYTISFSISLSNEYSGMISFRMDWLDLLAVQGTLKSLLQHHNS